jgi:uncharacterized protein
MPAHLSHLHIFPVKGLAGMRLKRARAEMRGLEGDRRWMVTDADGRFVSQRERADLTQLHAQPGEAGGIEISLAGQAPLRLAPPGPDSERRLVQIWDDHVHALACPQADAWLEAALGPGFHLVYMDAAAQRPASEAYAGPGYEVSFADAFPYLLLTTETLGFLNDKLAAQGEQAMEMLRFRPNLVVDGASAPQAEDSWGRIRIGEVVFRAVKPCARCVVTTLDPQTGAKGKEPLRTLATYRTQGGKVMFGQNMVAENEGWVEVGQAVELLD